MLSKRNMDRVRSAVIVTGIVTREDEDERDESEIARNYVRGELRIPLQREEAWS